MRFVFSNIAAALIRLTVITAITVFLAAYQLSPQSVVEALLNNPPAWTTNPLVRLGVLFLGGAAVALLLNWDRLFTTRLNRDRRALVDRAFGSLPLESREWLIQHYAGGRPTSPHAEILYELRLVDRDFVGWTEVKSDLKPFIAEKVSRSNSVFLQWKPNSDSYDINAVDRYLLNSLDAVCGFRIISRHSQRNIQQRHPDQGRRIGCACAFAQPCNGPY